MLSFGCSNISTPWTPANEADTAVDPALDTPGPVDAGPINEGLILAQALEIANRKLAAAKVRHYPPNHLFTVTEIGMPFGLKAVSLNKILETERIQYAIRRDGRQVWMLTPGSPKTIWTENTIPAPLRHAAARTVSE